MAFQGERVVVGGEVPSQQLDGYELRVRPQRVGERGGAGPRFVDLVKAVQAARAGADVRQPDSRIPELVFDGGIELVNLAIHRIPRIAAHSLGGDLGQAEVGRKGVRKSE